MKNKMMLGMVAVLFLALQALPGICAEERTPGPVDTPRAREIWAQAPQTPEELLRVIKVFMDNPQMNGFDIGEKIFGLAREAWGPVASVYANGPGKQRIDYVPFLRGGGQKGPPYKPILLPTPYYFGGEGVITLAENDELMRLPIAGFKETFCLTPTLTREILGEPSSISLSNKGGLSLTYRITRGHEKYGIFISYYDPSKPAKGISLVTSTTTNQQEFLEIIEDRKNFCAISVSIGRSNY